MVRCGLGIRVVIRGGDDPEKWVVRFGFLSGFTTVHQWQIRSTIRAIMIHL